MLIDLRTEGLNIYFLCPFLCSFCLIGANFCSGQSVFGKYAGLRNILFSISQIIAIIPYFISMKIQRNKSYSDSQGINEQILQINNNNLEEYSDFKIYQGVLLGFVNFLDYFVVYIGIDLFGIEYDLYLISTIILFLSFLQKYFFGKKIFRHQIAAMIIFFVFDIAFVIIIAFDNLLNYKLWHLFFIVISNLFFSFEMIYEKKILNNPEVSFYKLCFYLGIFSFTFNLIASIITNIIEYNIKTEDKYKIYLFNYKYYYEEVDDHVLVEIILIFVFVILNGVYNILQLLTIKYLSPNHVLITDIMLAIYESILTTFTDVETNNATLIFSFILVIINFFALFIYLGIIQLNFWGLNVDVSFKKGVKSDVKRYMESFSEGGDEIEIFDDSKERDNQKSENDPKNITSEYTSELESYEKE